MHPLAQAKTGPGIAGFEVGTSPDGLSGRCFYIIRTDGTLEDISCNKSIYPSTKAQEFRSVCRRLISFDVAIFKDDYFLTHERTDGRVQCPITGEWCNYEETQVDHAYPNTFEALIRLFLKERNIAEEDVTFREISRHAGKMFADQHLSEGWLLFHQTHAQLRVVSIEANLSILPKMARLTQRDCITTPASLPDPLPREMLQMHLWEVAS